MAQVEVGIYCCLSYLTSISSYCSCILKQIWEVSIKYGRIAEERRLNQLTVRENVLGQLQIIWSDEATVR